MLLTDVLETDEKLFLYKLYTKLFSDFVDSLDDDELDFVHASDPFKRKILTLILDSIYYSMKKGE